jgi:cystathionine beta-lyase
MDFPDFERKIAQGGVKLFLLCSPHNPVGRVWTKAELLKIRDICEAHGVPVVSDEIHCDFVWDGNVHTCFGALSDRAVIATAPSKTFNLAGLQAANIVVKDRDLRRRMKAEYGRSGYSQLNTMGLAACQSAYAHGAEWLAELKRYLAGNIDFTREFLSERLPGVKLVQPQGTYLLWLDFAAYGLSQEALDERITAGAGLWLDSGTMFGAEGEGFQRMNIACARATLKDALERLEREFARARQ